jgi:superfamily II DNA or RNA helicase
MTPRDYQIPAIQYLANIRRGILQAPAGSGKTFMAGAALADCLSRREGKATVKVLCNTIEQKGQWQDAFLHFPIIAKKAAVEISCHAASLDTWDADLLIVDECHRSASASWSAAINQAPKARWGVSATPWADPERDAILRKLFGSQLSRSQTRCAGRGRAFGTCAGALSRCRLRGHTGENRRIGG